jgi:phosphotransferase system enzyme I (PtsP)
MSKNKQDKKKLGVTTLEDISTLILQSHNLDETLENIVALVAMRTETDVCSIYLLDDDKETLRLRSTRGLPRDTVGKVSMSIHEGLTGLAVEQRRVVAIKEPRNHPRYRYFKETREERFHSFLGIPLFDRQEPIGALVIQTRKKQQFTPEEISVLSTIAFQVASIIINARLLDSIRLQKEQTLDHKFSMEPSNHISPASGSGTAKQSARSFLQGTVAYPGVCSGPAHLMDAEFGLSFQPDTSNVAADVEMARLEKALEKTRIQTLYLEKRVAERLTPNDAAIFHTHLMILEDRSFQEKIRSLISAGQSAFHAVQKVAGDYIEAFEKMEDPYLRERAADLKDIGRRLLASLTGQHRPHPALTREGILVAGELLPSDMAALDHQKIRGVAIEASGKNSHAVIMAKSLGIPALVGIERLREAVCSGDSLIVDANSGFLYINPEPRIVEEYKRLEEDRNREQRRYAEFITRPALSKDGVAVTLRANIGLISDVGVALRNGAEGIGLYRTEFPYMIRDTFPGRDDQYLLYRKVVESFEGQPVTIRTLDIGGDKGLPYYRPPKEENPFMGWRSVRFSLDNRDIFCTQIEAILMAAQHGPVKLLFPMISGMEEIRACKAVVEEARENLSKAGLPHTANVPLGVMIEVPAAVQLAPKIAAEIDFFALGTNDLIQYMLASDRNNPLVSKYYEPLHPSVLQVIKQVSAAALTRQKGLCICGEMATDPLNFFVLFGMGIREFSMAAPFLPRVKAFLSTVSADRAAAATEEVLEMTDSLAIRDYLKNIIDENPGPS